MFSQFIQPCPLKPLKPVVAVISGWCIGAGTVEPITHKPPGSEVTGFGSAFGIELDSELGLGAMPTAKALEQAIKMALEAADIKPEQVPLYSRSPAGVPCS